MQHYYDNVTSVNGVARAAASVLVQLNGITANIYSDNGVTKKANPTTTDSNGQFDFYAANGTYTITVTPPGGTSVTTTATLFDANDLAAPSGASQVGFTQSGTGAVARTVQDKQRDEVVHIKDKGGKCDGIADDTAALQAADAEAVATGRTLVIEGTPRITSPQTFSGKSRWRFTGATGTTNTDKPTSYLIKAATVAGDLLTFTASGVDLENIAIVGENGNTGNGLVLQGNAQLVRRPYVAGMGQDGIRIGKDTAGANVNSFRIEYPHCVYNGRHGIYVHDASVNANAGTIINPVCASNGGDGLHGSQSALGVTILCPTLESNTGWGAYFDSYFGYIGANVMIGGDIENNTAGNLYRAVPYQTLVIGTSVQGKTYCDRAQLYAWTPTIIGLTTAGTATYSVQEGEYEISGATVNFSAHLVWSGHTGTGQAAVPLPVMPYSSSPGMPYSPATLVALGAYTFGAGTIPAALVARDAQRVNFYNSNPQTGALGSQSIAAAGEIYLRGSFPLNAPNFFTM